VRAGCKPVLLERQETRMTKRHEQAPQHGIRADLVARVRREIQQGSYETPEKLEIAFRRLLEDMADSPSAEAAPPD
jgi:hypothetical protein